MKKIVLSLVGLCPMMSWAADQPLDIKPGLWDMTMSSQTSGAPPIPNLDQLTPEQRARIESAIKGARATTVKKCITRESIQKAIADASSNKGNACSPKLVSSSPSKLVFRIDCAGQRETKSSGEVTVERQDSEHFKADGLVKISSANGHSMDVKMSVTGTFVSSDCGDVKPSGE